MVSISDPSSGGKGGCEVAGRLEPDEEDALAVLGHDALGIDDAPMDLVAERVGEGVVDDLEGAALAVPDEVLDVLQHEGGRLVDFEDFGDGEEEVALFHVLEAVLAAEAVFLGDAGEAEGLAGKAAAEDVELGNVGHGHGMDVAVRGFAEVGGVGLLAELVPVAGEVALSACALEGDAEAADAAEEVNEARNADWERRRWCGRPPVPRGARPPSRRGEFHEPLTVGAGLSQGLAALVPPEPGRGASHVHSLAQRGRGDR